MLVVTMLEVHLHLGALCEGDSPDGEAAVRICLVTIVVQAGFVVAACHYQDAPALLPMLDRRDGNMHVSCVWVYVCVGVHIFIYCVFVCWVFINSGMCECV